MFESPYRVQQLAEARIRDAQIEAEQHRQAKLAKGTKGSQVRLGVLLGTVLHFITQS